MFALLCKQPLVTAGLALAAILVDYSQYGIFYFFYLAAILKGQEHITFYI